MPLSQKLALKSTVIFTIKNKTYYGIEAAKILMDKQLEGIEAASKAGIIVKTNTVVIKGINDQHVVEVIKTAMEKGAAISNLIPLIPVSGTKFEHKTTVSDEELAALRSAGGVISHTDVSL